MNIFNVYFPHLMLAAAILSFLCLQIVIVLLAGTLRIAIFHKAHPHLEHIGITRVMGLSGPQMDKLFFAAGVIMLLAVYILIFLSTTNRWIRVKPTPFYRKDTRRVKTAIILGFGYEEDENKNMKAGKANKALWEWTNENTDADNILVQEGIWIAAGCETKKEEREREKKEKETQETENPCTIDDKKIIRIHPHDKKIYVNTMKTAAYAMKKMEESGKDKAILVAHDLQLQRTAWNFESLKLSRKEWQGFTFVIPEIPDTPYPAKSVQIHTQNELFYKLAELYISRPRDFGGALACIVPLVLLGFAVFWLIMTNCKNWTTC